MSKDKDLKKCDELIERLQELKKALTLVPSTRPQAPGLPAGWSVDMGTGAYHHSGHGVISPGKQADGSFRPVHGGRSIGRFSTIQDAGKAIGRYVKTLRAGDTGSHNIDPMTMKSEADVEKSGGFKFKGGSTYDPAANAKRKMTNVGAERFGNQSTKSYTHNKAFKQKVPSGPAGPVKQFTPEQIAAINEANKLKKTCEDAPWVQHNAVPNADAEVTKLQQTNPAEPAENIMATQLANMMAGRNMLGIEQPKQLSADEFIRAGEAMGLGAQPEQIAKADEQWGGAINNWLAEAQKPISQRFASEEEEIAYWSSLKVAYRDDGKSGY